MSAVQWQKLGDEDLYIKCKFTQDSYSILLTDLCQLYAEELDADDLRWRASKARVPIDTDEAHNLSTLLKHLSTAVSDGSIAASSTSKARYFDLVAAVQLPKPLPEFDWTFKLEAQPDRRFRDDVSKPLLDQIDGSRQREDDLIHRLQDKDHVIDKLLDALDKHSVDLADVFPSLTSQASAKRSASRHDALSHIPALRSFDKEAWQDSFSAGDRYERQQGQQPVNHAKLVTDRTANKEPSKGIKRTLGKSKAAPLPPSSPEPVLPSRETPDTASTASIDKPKPGIRRSLGGKKSELARRTPDTTATDDATESEGTPSPQVKPKGIKRSLGGRRINDAAPLRDPSPKQDDNPGRQGPIETHVDKDDAVDRDAEADRLANEKREALKKQLATAGSKPKKRKF